MALMPEDVLSKNFTATQFRRGYDEHEVDDFLDEIVVELRRLSGENEALSKQLSECLEGKAQIAPDAQGEILAARVSAEEAERDSADRVARALAEAEQAEALAAERMRAAQETAPENAGSFLAASDGSPADSGVDLSKDSAAAEVHDDAGAGPASAAGVLALAEKLHEQYVTEGQQTRERLIGEGQLRHDQLVEEATAKNEELKESAQSEHDALVAEANALVAEASARHDRVITEALERATEMVADAEQKRAAMDESLGQERSLLQRKIDELSTFERDYRARLKSHIEGQLRELEEIGVDSTAGHDAAGDAGGHDAAGDPAEPDATGDAPDGEATGDVN